MPLLRRHHSFGFVALALLAAAGCSASSSDDASPGTTATPSNEPAPAASASATPAASPQVFVTSVDPALGTPNFLFAARSNVVRRREPGASVERAARRHLESLASRYHLPRQALDAAVATQVSDMGKAGAIVVLRQKIGDIEVVGRDAKILMDENLSLVAVGGSLHPAGHASPKLGRFVLAEGDAVTRALAALYPSSASSARLLQPARAKKVYFPVGERLVAAWSVELSAQVPGEDDEAYAFVVAAEGGRILHRKSLKQAATFNYRVHADASGRHTPHDGPIADLTPHPTGAPDGTSMTFVAPNLIAIDGFNATHDPWLADSATETRGNNVDAYTDDSVDGFSAGDLRASTTAPGTFDRTYDTGLAPTASTDQKMAAVTNAFFAINWLHDDWYDVGFDEASGNAQASNYGRGGVEGDAIRLELQDSANIGKRNNANAATYSDGTSPRLQFYLFDGVGGGPLRDGALDNSIIAHEWGHYLHQRLVDCGSDQCGAESEGWGDFVALHMSLRAGDALDGTYAIGQYASAALSSDTVYYGIRRVPYSVDLTKNGFTFKHISNGVTLPALPTNNSGYPNAEVHNAGEVWATMMWEAYVALQRRATGAAPAYSFDEARKRMATYVVGGMKLAPTSPTYTEQRDAIVAAAFARDPKDAAAIAEAFARRGAGTCAVSPDRDSSEFAGVVEDFALKADGSIASIVVDDAAISCDSDGWLDAGETGRAVVRVANRGGSPLTGARLTVASSLAGITFPDGATITVPTVPAFSTVDVPVKLTLAATTTGTKVADIGVTLDAPESCTTSTTEHVTIRTNFDEKKASSASDDVEASATAWLAKDLDGRALAGSIWRRTELEGGQHVWHADDHGTPSDTALESPSLVVGAGGSLTVAFAHRYEFESSDGRNYDGAVVEVSSDDGATWADASTVAAPTYGGQIGDPVGAAMNTLKGRNGYVGTSATNPAFVTETLDFGTAFAGKSVKIRFRIATDDAEGAAGWDIDDIRVTGTTNKPFATVVEEDGVCTNIPTANAGDDRTVKSGTTVTLDASASKAKGDGTLAFNWLQTGGPAVSLSARDAAKPSFTAPNVTAAEKLTFQLVVRDGLASAADTVDVTVEPGDGPNGGSNGDGADPNGAEVTTGGDDSGGGCSVGSAHTSGGGVSSLGLGGAALALAAIARRRRVVK